MISICDNDYSFRRIKQNKQARPSNSSLRGKENTECEYGGQCGFLDR